MCAIILCFNVRAYGTHCMNSSPGEEGTPHESMILCERRTCSRLLGLLGLLAFVPLLVFLQLHIDPDELVIVNRMRHEYCHELDSILHFVNWTDKSTWWDFQRILSALRRWRPVHLQPRPAHCGGRAWNQSPRCTSGLLMK